MRAAPNPYNKPPRKPPPDRAQQAFGALVLIAVAVLVMAKPEIREGLGTAAAYILSGSALAGAALLMLSLIVRLRPPRR
ncbi:hypothetical protein [Actinoplanes sp. DH11]|uniref:hypothetical protein n=1 Tax=Actinoplanes sp. DH11 TaxID=2857011 RepID=UPI001E4494E7|nr:hypothetical protein [Actinoplanes sp. DH11]